MSNSKLFGLSVLVSAVGMLGILFVQKQMERGRMVELTAIGGPVFLASQLKPENMAFLKSRGIRTVVDMRPDAEATDQPSSEVMREAAASAHLAFHYIPVPHESIPEEAADALQKVLDESRGRVVLYCRTGRRAVRLYALAVAGQDNALDPEAILDMVKRAGFDAEDLTEKIKQRISNSYHLRHDRAP